MFHIRPITESDIEPIVQLSLQAWEPVFLSFEQILGSRIFSLVYPDWRAMQRAAIECVCKDPDRFTTYVAEVDEAIAGFIIYSVNLEKQAGEVEFLAVRPDE